MGLTLQRGAASSRSGTVTPAGNEHTHSAHSFAVGDSDPITATTGADGCCAISGGRTDAVRAAPAATNRGSAIGTRERATDDSSSTPSPDCSRTLSAPANRTAGGGAATPAAPSPPSLLPAEAAMSAADRRQVQEALRRADFYKGPADGIFGPLTRAAIRRFQQDIRSDATGTLTADQANRLVAPR